MSNLIQITATEAPKQLWHVMSRGLTPMLTSSPGIGKSSIAKQIAKEQNLKVLDLRLSQCDVTDMNGFPMISEDRTKASYVPMDSFPMEGDEIPDGYDGWLLLLDEINSAAKSVQAAA
jgi:MoxR-like ATPase